MSSMVCLANGNMEGVCGTQVNFPLAQQDRYVNIVRWYDYIANVVDKDSLLPKASFKKPALRPPPPPAPVAKVCLLIIIITIIVARFQSED
jgi:hypothetical protein